MRINVGIHASNLAAMSVFFAYMHHYWAAISVSYTFCMLLTNAQACDNNWTCYFRSCVTLSQEMITLNFIAVPDHYAGNNLCTGSSFIFYNLPIAIRVAFMVSHHDLMLSGKSNQSSRNNTS